MASSYAARRLAVAALVGFVSLSCGDGARDTGLRATPTSGTETTGAVGALNHAPSLVVRTQPAAQHAGAGDAVIRTGGTVRFNACDSTDADAGTGGDTLNWQFHFGDSGTPAFDDQGRFVPDVARTCRTEHSYARGTYTATVSVTDKHLDDQGNGYAALARATARFTIVSAGEEAPPAVRLCSAPAIVEGFEAYAEGTPGSSVIVPGLTFSGDGEVEANHLSRASPANARLLVGNGIRIDLAEPRDSIRFYFAGIPGWALSVYASCMGPSCGDAPGFGGRYGFPVDDTAVWQEGVIELRGKLFDTMFLTSGVVMVDDLELWCE